MTRRKKILAIVFAASLVVVCAALRELISLRAALRDLGDGLASASDGVVGPETKLHPKSRILFANVPIGTMLSEQKVDLGVGFRWSTFAVVLDSGTSLNEMDTVVGTIIRDTLDSTLVRVVLDSASTRPPAPAVAELRIRGRKSTILVVARE